MDTCLSDFALDDHELHGTAPPTAVTHLEGCRACQTRLAERRTRVGEFQDRWSTVTWQRISAARTGAGAARRRRWARLSGVTLLGAAVASLLVVALPSGLTLPSGGAAPGRRGNAPSPKGTSVAQIICRRGVETFVIGAGDEVRPGDELRFRPLPGEARAGYVQVGSVDGTGAYAAFYPPGDTDVSVALPPEGQPLPDSIRLDDAPGPERVLVVLSATPLPVRDVRAAALAHVARADRMDRIGTTPVTSAWIVFPKRRAVPSGP